VSCCCVDATGAFFDKQARRMEKYFRKKGLRREQQFLVEGIRQNGMENVAILEIGCGVGALHLSLLKAGATKAVGIDMSEKMIDAAQKLSKEMDLARRTQYVRGDFVAMHEAAPVSDVAILDKVICCYENVQELIAHSTAKAKRLYAVSYPRQHWFAKSVFHFAAAAATLFRWKFHPYYHQPALIQGAIADRGFEKNYERQTLMWVIQVFQRRSGNGEERA
jgi:magnesium-protoporphyrin O-methyltransferase